MIATDLLLLAVIAVSALLGLMRGFVGVLASLVMWLFGGWVAFRFGDDVAVEIAHGPPGTGELLAGYGLSFVAVMLVVGLVAGLIRMLVRSAGLSGIDRTLGLAVGAARGALLACVLVLLMGFTPMPRNGAWHGSKVVPALLPGAQWMRGWLPPAVARQVNFSGSAQQRGTIERLLDESPLKLPANALALPTPAGA